MKWVKLVEDNQRGDECQTPSEKACFKSVTHNQLSKDFGVWAHYRFPPDFKISRRGKKDYETYIGGFLTFYDDVVRNAVIDHAVFFKWEAKDKTLAGDEKGLHVYESVTIFVSPKPERKDPRKYPSVHTRDGSPSQFSEAQLREFYAQQTGPVAGFGDLIDPPPPPPPPPPSIDDLDEA